MTRRFSPINTLNIIAVLVISAAFVIPLIFILLEFFTDKKTSILYDMFYGDKNNQGFIG